MTYLIPSIIAAVIIWIFARRLNTIENSDASYAMDAMATAEPQALCNQIDSPERPSAESATPPSSEESTCDAEQGERREPYETAQTVSLIMDLLKKIGCKPEEVKEGVIRVTYQGENFIFQVDGVLVEIYDLSWSHFKADDPDAPVIRESINKTNFGTMPTVLMQAPNDDGDVGIISRYQTLIHPSCSINDEWISFIFGSFFAAQRLARENCRELIAEQQQRQTKSRRPIGFTTQEATEQ